MTPKLRQSVYLLAVIAGGAVALLSLWNIVDPETAATLAKVITGLGGMFGTAAAATAAVTVSKQRKDGTLDPAPAPAPAVVEAAAPVSMGPIALQALQAYRRANRPQPPQPLPFVTFTTPPSVSITSQGIAPQVVQQYWPTPGQPTNLTRKA